MDAGLYGAMDFPSKLEHLISMTGTTQTALSRETGIGQSAISAMTRGERRPYADQALRLARALGVPLDYLIDDEVDEPPGPELTDDEQAVLDLYRALRLDRQEALRRLAAPSETWNPGSVRDLTPQAQAAARREGRSPKVPKNASYKDVEVTESTEVQRRPGTKPKGRKPG